MPGPVFKRDGVVLTSEFGLLLPPDKEWLAQETPEEILFPDLPIIDTQSGQRLHGLPEFCEISIGSGSARSGSR